MLAADQGSYFVRLGDLAPSFRQRAFEHALSHLQHGQFQARAALAQLEDAFRLVRAFPSPAVCGDSTDILSMEQTLPVGH